MLLAHASAILARIQAAHADFDAFGQGALGVLRVGTYQSVSTRILPPRCACASSSAPEQP